MQALGSHAPAGLQAAPIAALPRELLAACLQTAAQGDRAAAAVRLLQLAQCSRSFRAAAAEVRHPPRGDHQPAQAARLRATAALAQVLDSTTSCRLAGSSRAPVATVQGHASLLGRLRRLQARTTEAGLGPRQLGSQGLSQCRSAAPGAVQRPGHGQRGAGGRPEELLAADSADSGPLQSQPGHLVCSAAPWAPAAGAARPTQAGAGSPSSASWQGLAVLELQGRVGDA